MLFFYETKKKHNKLAHKNYNKRIVNKEALFCSKYAPIEKCSNVYLIIQYKNKFLIFRYLFPSLIFSILCLVYGCFVSGLFETWPDRGCALIKKDLKYAGPFGLAGILCGAVFIDRLNHEKALETMQKTAKILHDRNVSGGGVNRSVATFNRMLFRALSYSVISLVTQSFNSDQQI